MFCADLRLKFSKVVTITFKVENEIEK